MVPKRALFSNLPLEIGPNLTVSVKGYIIFKRQEPKKSASIYMAGDEPKLVLVSSAKTAEDTGQMVEKVEIHKAYKFGGEQVTFTQQEIIDIRNFGDPVIRIIGFKNVTSASLPVWANIKGPTFLYPSEEDYVGSTRVFSALRQKLLKDRKMAVSWFIARKNAVPQIVALIPDNQNEQELDEQILPSGLWLVPLPFADDIRDNPDTISIMAPDSLIDKMRVVIQQLQLPKGQYVPTKYPNPGTSVICASFRLLTAS